MCSCAYFYQGNAKQTHTALSIINFVLKRMLQSLKVSYKFRISYQVPNPVFFFLREGRGGAYLKRDGRLFQIVSLRRGTYSKRGTYLKLDANLSINGKIVNK